MKQKILMVCEAFGGGVFAYVSQLCNDLCNDFDVYLAYSVRSQTPKNYKDFINPQIHMIEVNAFGGSLINIVADIKAIRELHKIAKKVQPDIIHLHSSIAGGLGRLAYNEKNGYRLIYTPHGYAHILMGDEHSLRCKLYKFIEILLGRKKHITLTCCKSEDDIAKTLTRNTAYVETGINIKEFQSTIDPIVPEEQGKFTVYAMGRICAQKRPDLFNAIAEKVPEARFVWIGTGELQHLLTAKNLTVTGWKARYEALAMGKGADAYILCSFGEAIAMSLLENMYMGKLCLVSNTMGNKSVIKNSLNGYVCSDVDDYVRYIRMAMETFPKQIVEQAKKDVIEYYNTNRMKDDFVQFYGNAIKGQYSS